MHQNTNHQVVEFKYHHPVGYHFPGFLAKHFGQINDGNDLVTQLDHSLNTRFGVYNPGNLGQTNYFSHLGNIDAVMAWHHISMPVNFINPELHYFQLVGIAFQKNSALTDCHGWPPCSCFVQHNMNPVKLKMQISSYNTKSGIAAGCPRACE